MALSRDLQRATLAIRDVLARGGRVLRSSRAFWSRYGFPAIEARTEAIQTARELLRVANEIEAGSLRGTIAEAMQDAGIPTSDLSGGLTGGPEGTVYARLEFTTPEGGKIYRSVRRELPWFSSIDQLESMFDDLIEAMESEYEVEGGNVASGSMVIY